MKTQADNYRFERNNNGSLDFYMTRGNDVTLDFLFTESSTGDIIDVTNFVLWFVVRNDYNPLDTDNSEAILKISSSSGDTVNGLISLIIPSEDVEFEVGSYLYEFLFFDSSGNKITTKKGKFILENNYYY